MTGNGNGKNSFVDLFNFCFSSAAEAAHHGRTRTSGWRRDGHRTLSRRRQSDPRMPRFRRWVSFPILNDIKWAIPGLFLFIFVLFTSTINRNKHKSCAWDSNPELWGRPLKFFYSDEKTKWRRKPFAMVTFFVYFKILVPLVVSFEPIFLALPFKPNLLPC